MGYLLARKERETAFWSSSPLLVTDLIHLLSMIVKGKKKKPDLMDQLLGQLWDPAAEEGP